LYLKTVASSLKIPYLFTCSLEMKFITLKVGKSSFETTKAELQAQDPDSYFHAQFSGCWDKKDAKPYLKERSGRLFLHVPHYLQCRDLPRNTSSGRTTLDEATLKSLKEEAEVYLLSKLAKLCEDPSLAPLFMVSEYYMDSDKSTGVVMRRFESYPEARGFFDDKFPSLHGIETRR